VDLASKLAILADAAKYDASASSGGVRRDFTGARGLGSNEGTGICHSYAPDGRCISLLKILLTNWCQYDCLYCVNRVSSNAVPGEGPLEARVMVVGEQPGEQDDLRGRPFVGPAGQLFDRALAQLGVARETV
jgi:uracil-DNA glycosylase